LRGNERWHLRFVGEPRVTALGATIEQTSDVTDHRNVRHVAWMLTARTAGFTTRVLKLMKRIDPLVRLPVLAALALTVVRMGGVYQVVGAVARGLDIRAREDDRGRRRIIEHELDLPMPVERERQRANLLPAAEKVLPTPHLVSHVCTSERVGPSLAELAYLVPGTPLRLTIVGHSETTPEIAAKVMKTGVHALCGARHPARVTDV
jgi:hypothetical protein